jgi:hypothetical protein
MKVLKKHAFAHNQNIVLIIYPCGDLVQLLPYSCESRLNLNLFSERF